MIAPQWRWWLWDGKLYPPERFTWAAWHRGLMTTGASNPRRRRCGNLPPGYHVG